MAGKGFLTASMLFTLLPPALGQVRGSGSATGAIDQRFSATRRVDNVRGPIDAQSDSDLHFTSRADSMDWVRYKGVAAKSSGFRLIVSLQARRLWAIDHEDTLLHASVSVAKGTTLSYAGRTFTFKMPRGPRRVLDKSADPAWQPPDWLYIETADEYGLKVASIPERGSITTSGHLKATPHRSSEGEKGATHSEAGSAPGDEGFKNIPLTFRVTVTAVDPLLTRGVAVIGSMDRSHQSADVGCRVIDARQRGQHVRFVFMTCAG